MFSSQYEWKIIAETDFCLNQSCSSIISQLSKIWWRLCASVNHRIACTQFLNEQNTPVELLDEINANLSPMPSISNVKLWRDPTIMQLFPKSHFHRSFSDRCFEVVEFGGDEQKEFVAIFRSAQLPPVTKIDDSEVDETERNIKHRQNPHISYTYAFHLTKTLSNSIADTNADNKFVRTLNSSLKLWCHSEMSSAQMGFMLKWLWPRLQKWAYKIAESGVCVNYLPEISMAGDNRLLNNQKAYIDRYWRLKTLYGPHQQMNMEQNHGPSLNYECCAVAAYLLELWKTDGVGPKRGFFVDIECGKGLLAHLLQMEGAPGVGVHRREKAQWAAFKSHGTRLVELETVRDISMANIIQSTVTNEVDFLIGNRCDQMISWIPLIAAKLRCNFFLLPNIPTNFYCNFGKRSVAKYERHLPSGRLDQYYAFLEQISKSLGFEVAFDQLKIPSRRRKCVIGIVPSNGLPNANELDNVIDHLLASSDVAGRKPTKGTTQISSSSK